jgi:IS30 family transposase
MLRGLRTMTLEVGRRRKALIRGCDTVLGTHNRVRRARRDQRGFITPEVTLARRPAEVADRDAPGHWRAI